jgi:MBG domain (YGX type)
LGSVAKGTALSFANTPCVSGASQNLQIKVTGLGGSQSLSWAGAFASGVANNATLSPLTTLSPTSGTISGNGNAVACIGISIATGSLTAGTTYHGDLRYTQTGGASSNDFPHDYFFKFTVTSAQQAQTITFAQPTSPQAYGSTFHVNPTSSSGLPVSVAASGPCSASAAAPGYDVTMTSGTGTCTLTASQAGDANFTAAQNVVRTVTAQPRPITVTADPKSKVYGQADPALTYEVTSGSLESGDSFTGNLARAAGESVAGSPYAIKQGSLTAGTNYDLTFVGANLTITPHDLHVAAHPQTKVYGQADPELTYTVTQSDLQYSDTNAVVSGSLARNPGQTVAGGPYAITKGSLTANDNYTLLFTGANLTITKAPLTVTADEKAILLNGTVSALTATLTGFQYGETLLTSGVTGTAACTTSDGKSIGTFDIVCRAGTLQASNYSFGPLRGGEAHSHLSLGRLSAADQRHGTPDGRAAEQVQARPDDPGQVRAQERGGCRRSAGGRPDVLPLRQRGWLRRYRDHRHDRRGPAERRSDLRVGREPVPLQLEHQGPHRRRVPDLREPRRRDQAVRRHLPRQVGGTT